MSARTTVLGLLAHRIKVKGVVTLLAEFVYDEGEVRVVDSDVETRLFASLLDDGQGAPVTIQWPWLEAQRFERLHAEGRR